METRHYKDYFMVPANYTANMTREAINEAPDIWLDFYPHAKYLDFLKTLFDEKKSVWLTGNYGTGKSNAALVTQKLFMDDISRVNQWFKQHSAVIPNCDALKKQLLDARNAGILVVYDYNASGVGPNEEFLVRLEKGILAALKEHGLESPAKANLDLVIERIQREGDNFFDTRDSMINEMKYLKSDIRTVDQLVALLREEETASTPTHYLDDVQAVLHKDNIYLNVDVTTFRNWISAICKANGLKRIIYIFDEFSDFIDANSGTLKTFEDVSEAPAVNHFYLVPVTHMEIKAFYSENSPGANKARDRFYFRNLQMPNEVAFQLAASAMKPIEEEPYFSEWKEEKELLWNSIASVVDRFDAPETSEAYVSRQSFHDILPIHPMAAFLLKFLSESVGSDQRSIFEYLKGSANGREFQEFIAVGGPQIAAKQFLTVDYLWKYFMEREDLGQSKETIQIKMEYNRIKAREFAHFSDDTPEIRVLKTVMLFTLLSRLNPNGHDRLQPTVENIELAFRGDAVVMDASMYLRDLAENRHCFSIVNGNIELYSTTVGNDDLEKKKQEFSDKFHDLLSDRCKNEMENNLKSARAKFSSGRFEVRVSDESHAKLTNITPATREKYSRNLNKDDGSICIWFIVARNRDEQMRIQGRRENIFQQLYDHRIIMVDFPEVTFCGKNQNLWDEYVTLRAQYLLENNSGSKQQIKDSYTRIETEWTNSLKDSKAINISYYNLETKEVVTRRDSWSYLKTFLTSYTRLKLEACPDIITDQLTAFSNKGLKAWALAGIKFDDSVGHQQGQLIHQLKSQGIDGTDEWFSNNPNHPFSAIRSLLQKKYDNTVGRNTNFSLRKVFIELKRAPYGMRYNCLSAFSLGFCLRWVLKKNCQWTNGQINHALDEETLAEIIDVTVAEKTDKEKFICRLSKEERTFARKAGCMFGMAEREDSTTIETLNAISSNVEANSYNVPLWIIPEYIRIEHPEHENVAAVFENLCKALRISSKGNTDERSVVISDIGKELLQNEDIIDTARLYTTKDVYTRAFRKYVDTNSPQLVSLAEKVGDKTHAYCTIILEMSAPSSGWLWNKFDISSTIENVEVMYHIIAIAQEFLKISGYLPYDDAISRLRDKLKNAGIPYELAKEKFPDVGLFIRELFSGQNIRNLYESFKRSRETLELLYCDPKFELSTKLVREHIGVLDIDDESLLRIIEEMPSTEGYSADMSTDTYIKLVRRAIDNNIRNMIIRKNNMECKRICGFENVQEWTNETHLPAWTLFTEADNGREIVKILMLPGQFTNDVLEKNYSILEMIPIANIKQCRNTFLQQIVPKQYSRLNIELASLLKYISNKYGNDANKWPDHPDIDEFIREQYREVFAPEIVGGLRLEDAEHLKEKLLELAKVDPDIGLKFWEE